MMETRSLVLQVRTGSKEARPVKTLSPRSGGELLAKGPTGITHPLLVTLGEFFAGFLALTC